MDNLGIKYLLAAAAGVLHVDQRIVKAAALLWRTVAGIYRILVIFRLPWPHNVTSDVRGVYSGRYTISKAVAAARYYSIIQFASGTI